MENAVLVSLLKWFFPSLVGALLAVYYKSKMIGWSEISTVEKVYFTLVGLGAVCLSVIISYYMGGSVIDYFNIPHDTNYAYLIHFFFAFSGLKITDSLTRNIDDWITKISEAITRVLDKFLDKF